MAEHVVAPADSLDDGDALVVDIEGREVGVFNVDGEYHALLNWCAHQGGPVCEGSLSGTYEESFDRQTLAQTGEWVKEGRILNCPWHGWEYDVTTGECLSTKSVSLPKYPVREEDGDVIVDVR